MLKILLNTVNCQGYPELTTESKPARLEQNKVYHNSTTIPTNQAVNSGH